MINLNSVLFWQGLLLGLGGLTLFTALFVAMTGRDSLFLLKGQKHGKKTEPPAHAEPVIQSFVPTLTHQPSRIVVVKAAITETVRMKFADACSSSQKLLAAIKPASPTLEQS